MRLPALLRTSAIGLVLFIVPALAREPVEHPTPEQMEPTVREQAEQLRRDVERLTGQEPPPRVELAEAFGRLGRFYQAHRFLDAAASSLRNALALDPGPRWRYPLAVLHQERGELDRAAEVFREVTREAPGNAVAARIRLGQVEIRRNRPEPAMTAFEEALARDPRSAAALAGLGQALQLQGRHEEAISRLRRALEIQPEADRLHHLLGLSFRALGELEAARTHLQAAGNVAPGFPEPWLEPVASESLGVLQKEAARAMREGRAADAAALMRRVLERRPEDPAALRSLAAALEATGDVEEALKLYRRAVAVDPGDPTSQGELGRILLLHSRSTEAVKPLGAAVELAPGDASLRVALARALLESDRAGDALVHSREATRLDPALLEARRQEARILTELARYGEAARSLEELAAAGQATPGELLDLATLHLRSGNQERAETLLRGLLEEGGEPAILGLAGLGLGNLLLQRGEPADAIPHFRSALEIDPGFVDARFNLGLALLRVGRAGEAITVLEPLVREHPTPTHAELMAMALATGERYREAASLQERVLRAAEEGRAPVEVIHRLRENLERYRAGLDPRQEN